MQNKKENRILDASCFSVHSARMWTHVKDLKDSYCLYLLNTSYKDEIERSFKSQVRRSTVVYHNKDNPSKALDLYAVKFIRKDNEDVLCASPVTVFYSDINGHIKEEKSFGNWVPITNPDRFEQAHKKHLIRYYFNQLSDASPIKKLQQQYKALVDYNRKGSLKAGLKAQALKTFLNTIENGDLEGFFDILINPQHMIFKQMVTPRPVKYDFWFFTIHTQAKNPESTATYKILKALRKETILKDLWQELKKASGARVEEGFMALSS